MLIKEKLSSDGQQLQNTDTDANTRGAQGSRPALTLWSAPGTLSCGLAAKP